MLFPDYKRCSPIVSTAYRIKQYAKRAAERIRKHEEAVLAAARTIDSKATVDLETAYKKLENVKRKRLSTVWGQASATCIEISSAPMREDYVLGTLIHEALHDCFFHENNIHFTEDKEHNVMSVLGEI